jgi:copper transport protein
VRLVRRWCGLVAIATILVLATAVPASAHAELIDTDPDEGAVLAQAPDVVRLSFNEPVRGVPDGVAVFDAEGEPIASSSRTRDKELLVSLDEAVGNGSIVVAWRVVSADGHPISGTLTFAIGAPSPTVQAPDVDGGDDVPLTLSLTRWPAYAGLLMAVGLVWFVAMLAPAGLDKLDRAQRRLRGAAQAAAVAAAVAWLVGLPLTARYLRGGGSLTEAATWRALPAGEVALPLVTAAAVLAAAWLLPTQRRQVRPRQLPAVVGLLALSPLPFSGHTRAESDAALVMAVDGMHLVAGSVWLGGLVGLAIVLPGLAGRRELAAALVSRFSTTAATVLAALVLSGAFLAWRIVGSWSGLVHSGYGQLLLVKVAVAATAAALAGYNRFRLLPLLEGARGFHDRLGAGRSVTRTASAEAVALVGVLLVTGFLVQKSPPRESLAASAAAQTARSELGDLEVFVTLSPGVTGMNTVTIRLRDATGDAAPATEPPRVRITSANLGGDVPLAPTGSGTFEGRVVVPSKGLWQVQVSLRLGEFENPVASLDFQVG